MTALPLTRMKRAPAIAKAAALCALVGISDASAFSGFGTAVVEDRDGKPCFGLPTRTFESLRSPRPLRALTVHRNVNDEVWSFSYHPGPAVLLRPGQCIVYGELPVSATSPAAPQPLVPGALYEVYLNAPTSGLIRGYYAKFCLKTLPDGSTRVIPVRYDERKGWTAEVCKP